MKTTNGDKKGYHVHEDEDTKKELFSYEKNMLGSFSFLPLYGRSGGKSQHLE